MCTIQGGNRDDKYASCFLPVTRYYLVNKVAAGTATYAAKRPNETWGDRLRRSSATNPSRSILDTLVTVYS